MEIYGADATIFKIFLECVARLIKLFLMEMFVAFSFNTNIQSSLGSVFFSKILPCT